MKSLADNGPAEQNRIAEQRIRTERVIGLHIAEEGDTALPEMSDERRRAALKLASVPGGDFEAFITNTLAAGRELTMTAALKLAPVKQRTPRSGIAQSYTAPPIDVQIAREFGLEASDERVELITRAIQSALESMTNPRHAFVWARYHGIEDDGMMGDRWTYAAIAVQMGCSREYVESLYYRASHHVLSRVSAAALNAWTTAMHAR